MSCVWTVKAEFPCSVKTKSQNYSQSLVLAVSLKAVVTQPDVIVELIRWTIADLIFKIILLIIISFVSDMCTRPWRSCSYCLNHCPQVCARVCLCCFLCELNVVYVFLYVYIRVRDLYIKPAFLYYFIQLEVSVTAITFLSLHFFHYISFIFIAHYLTGWAVWPKNLFHSIFWIWNFNKNFIFALAISVDVSLNLFQILDKIYIYIYCFQPQQVNISDL